MGSEKCVPTFSTHRNKGSFELNKLNLRPTSLIVTDPSCPNTSAQIAELWNNHQSRRSSRMEMREQQQLYVRLPLMIKTRKNVIN